MKNTDKFATILREVPGFLNLATSDASGKVSVSIISFVCDTQKLNVFYVVTAKNSQRSKNIREHAQVAISSWYNPMNGNRFSSNRVVGKVIDNIDEIKALHEKHPEIKIMTDDFAGQCVLVLKIESAILESFTGNPEIVEF